MSTNISVVIQDLRHRLTPNQDMSLSLMRGAKMLKPRKIYAIMIFNKVLTSSDRATGPALQVITYCKGNVSKVLEMTSDLQSSSRLLNYRIRKC